MNDIMFTEHNTKGGLSGHFNHVDPTKVDVSSLLSSLEMWGKEVTTMYGEYRHLVMS